MCVGVLRVCVLVCVDKGPVYAQPEWRDLANSGANSGANFNIALSFVLPMCTRCMSVLVSLVCVCVVCDGVGVGVGAGPVGALMFVYGLTC